MADRKDYHFYSKPKQKKISYMNAKQELLDIVQEENLTIIEIRCEILTEVRLSISTSTQTYILKSIKGDIDALDFEYNEEYGFQKIHGNVYCEDSEGNPVLLTRVEYNGYERWGIVKLPDYYKQ